MTPNADSVLDLLRALLRGHVEYRPGAFDDPPSVKGYDSHEVLNLSAEQDALVRELLGVPPRQIDGSVTDES